jgi:hypothetical protein
MLPVLWIFGTQCIVGFESDKIKSLRKDSDLTGDNHPCQNILKRGGKPKNNKLVTWRFSRHYFLSVLDNNLLSLLRQENAARYLSLLV